MEVWGSPKIIKNTRKRFISMSNVGLNIFWVKISNGKWFYVQMNKIFIFCQSSNIVGQWSFKERHSTQFFKPDIIISKTVLSHKKNSPKYLVSCILKFWINLIHFWAQFWGPPDFADRFLGGWISALTRWNLNF